jgi:hypothetical protein
MSIFDRKPLIGWGVVREEPWDFAGLYETQIEAAAKAIDMGIGYQARFGESSSKDAFVWKDERA